MEKITQPSSPLMAVPPDVPPDVPPVPLTDDIEDPPVPAGLVQAALAASVPQIPDALLPLAHGFCQYLQTQVHTFLGDEHRALMKSVDASLASVRAWTEGMLQGNEHSQYTMGDALAKLHEHGANLVHANADPYHAVITARTPNGFALQLTIEKATSGELIEELGRVEGWLVANGYTVVEGVAA